MQTKLSNLDNLVNHLINDSLIKHTINIEIKSIFDIITMHQNLTVPCENLRLYGYCKYNDNCWFSHENVNDTSLQSNNNKIENETIINKNNNIISNVCENDNEVDISVHHNTSNKSYYTKHDPYDSQDSEWSVKRSNTNRKRYYNNSNNNNYQQYNKNNKNYNKKQYKKKEEETKEETNKEAKKEANRQQKMRKDNEKNCSKKNNDHRKETSKTKTAKTKTKSKSKKDIVNKTDVKSEDEIKSNDITNETHFKDKDKIKSNDQITVQSLHYKNIEDDKNFKEWINYFQTKYQSNPSSLKSYIQHVRCFEYTHNCVYALRTDNSGMYWNRLQDLLYKRKTKDIKMKNLAKLYFAHLILKDAHDY